MKLTSKQHRNIANGMDRIKEACEWAMIVYKHLPSYNAASFYSYRFKTL